MTSRERVLAAFNHTQSDIVPRWCGASPEFLAKACRQLNLSDNESFFIRIGDDFRRVFARYVGPEFPLSPGSVCRTVFGIERAGHGCGQPLSHPLADATLQQVHDYPWPDPDWQDVSRIRADALAWNRQYAVLGGDWSPFWHDAIDLLGMETLYLKLYDEPETRRVFTTSTPTSVSAPMRLTNIPRSLRSSWISPRRRTPRSSVIAAQPV